MENYSKFNGHRPRKIFSTESDSGSSSSSEDGDSQCSGISISNSLRQRKEYANFAAGKFFASTLVQSEVLFPDTQDPVSEECEEEADLRMEGDASANSSQETDFEESGGGNEVLMEIDEDVQASNIPAPLSPCNWAWNLGGATKPAPTFDDSTSGWTCDINANMTELEYFKLTFSEQVQREIVQQTNKYATQELGKSRAQSRRQQKFKPVTEQEFLRYLAIRIIMGIDVKPWYSHYWCKDPILQSVSVPKIMSADRFFAIQRYLHFSDNDEVSDDDDDRIIKIRNVWEMVTQTFKSLLPQQKPGDAQQPLHPHQSKRLSEDNNQPILNIGGGLRGALASNNNNNRIYPQEELTSALAHPPPLQQSHLPPSSHSGVVDGGGSFLSSTEAPINHDDDSPTDNTNSGGTGLLSPLRERLAAIEELTTSLQSWQTTEKTEYEKCVNDLANQVSRAVALQQLMKGEVEKLQQRVVDLENHNKAMATMIIPTLMKLHDTTVGSIGDAPQLKSIEPAPPQQQTEEGDHQLMSTSRMGTMMTGSDCDSLQRRSRLPHHSHSTQAELSPHNSLSRSYVISRGDASASPSRTRMGCYETENDSSAKTGTGSIKWEKPQQAPSPSPSLMSTSTPAPASTSVRSSPVKAPRTSKMTSGIPKMNGSSNGNISGSCLSSSSTTSLSRSNSCNTRGNTNPNTNQLLASSREIEPSSLSSQDNQGAGTSLELSISSNSEISTSQTPRTGIPRVSSSPARTSRTVTGGGGTTPKPARRTTTATINAGPVSDSRSSSPQRGSRLPVRKTTLVPTTTSGSRGHPAATSKSLPSHGTAFQSMSKSGPETTKHSKSTFGFGSPTRKSSAIPNRPGSNVPGTRVGPGNKASPNPTNLPDSVQTSSTKPLRLLSNPISASGISGPKVSGSGKDEGYSTMSSEALAEQEHHLLHCQHQLNQTPILEKSPNHRVTSLGGAPSNNKVMIPAIFSRAKVASLPKTNKITGIGSPTATIVPSAVDSLESEGGKRSSIHKSNTFNTFREMDRETRARNQSQRSYRVCDDEDVEDNECDGREILPPRTSYSSGGSTSKQCTSLPTSSSSASSSPCKTSKASTSSPSKRTSKPGRVTTTRMMDGNIVRIVRGSPYSIRFGEESGDDMEDEEDPSSSTILWEDSDDSDILFLPLEVSGSHSPTSSRSTLVPPPQSSGESRSYYSSWGRGTTTTATCSTLERGDDDAEGSNASLNNDSITNVSGGGGGTYNKRAYPLKRTKGEVTVDILLGNQNPAGGDGLVESSRNNTKAKLNNKISNKNGGGHMIEGVVLINETDLVVNPDHDIHLLNNPIHANQDDLEEKALIEKWMQLEEVRNEQVHGDGGEQWAWDWDGVERTYTRVLRNGRIRMREIPVELDEDDDDIIDVDLILEENGLGDDADDVEKVVEERNALNETTMQIDSSTWTKSSKAKPKSAPSQSHNNKAATTIPPSNSQEASPEKMRLEKGDSSAIPSLEGECEDGPLIKPDGGNEPSRFSDENVIASQSSIQGKSKIPSLSSPKKAHSPAINLDENGMAVTSCGVDGDDINLEENGGADADGEDDPPPVIEFTPEFYRLANYGSNLSFSDNESPNPNSVTQSPKLLNKVATGGAGVNNNKSGPSSPARSPKKRRHAQRRSHSTAHPDPGVALPSPQKPHPAPQIPPILGKMDDKVSQTDFSCSSLENMSSVSSDLSAECRNCLDIIKKLVVNNGDTDEGDEEGSSGSSFRPHDGGNNSGAFILQNGGARKKVDGEPGTKVDAGSYATTWISVPKGLPTAEVDRILEILSSSESEGVLSPK